MQSKCKAAAIYGTLITILFSGRPLPGIRHAIVRAAGSGTSRTAIRLACSVARTNLNTVLSYSDVKLWVVSKGTSGRYGSHTER